MTKDMDSSAIKAETIKVLLADDEEVVRHVGSDILKILGYQTILACNGMEAASLYAQHHAAIGCVILDWYMPGISGMEVLQRLWDVDKNAKVLIASGMGPPKELQELINAGHPVHLLHKPYLVKDLQSKLARLMK